MNKKWFRKLLRDAKNVIIPFTAPYLVLVNMEGKVCKHYCWTLEDAMEWLPMYDAADKVEVHYMYAFGWQDSMVMGRRLMSDGHTIVVP